MRGRVVLLVVLAVAVALVAVYVAGWSPSTPTTAGEPPAPSGSSVAPAQQDASQVAQSTQQPAAKKPQPQPSTDPVRFGPVGDAGWGSVTEVSEDRRALSTTFEDFQVGLGNDDVPDPSRLMEMTIPLTDGVEGETLYIHAQGYSIADEHAKAKLALRARGQTVVQRFPSGWDDEFVTTLELPAVPGATYQLSAVLEVEERSDSGGAAYLNISSFEAEIR